jgi:beta-mannanase
MAPKPRPRTVLVLLLTFAVSLPLLTPEPASAAQSGVLFGAYRVPRNGDWSQTGVKSSIATLETYLGRKLAIDHHYYAWGKAFPTWAESWDISQGRYPMISWGPVSTSSVNSGSLDAYIRARADGVKALGSKVFLRWFYEMDAAALANKTGTAAQYIAAWKHIQAIFDSRGATNAVWVWCPNAFNFSSGKSQTYYPGGAYVDWICADGYNWAGTKTAWTSFAGIFKSFYTWASTRGKPLMVGETASLERSAGEKATWINGMCSTVKNTYTAIHAVVWFDGVGTSYQGGTYDWRTDSSSSSYTSYKNMSLDTYFRPARAV